MDRDPEARIRRQPGEPVRLSLVGPGGQSVEQSTIPGDYSRDLFELELPQAGVIGVVLRDDVPQAGEIVLLRSMASGAVQARARTHSSGEFMVSYLPPGQYVIQIREQSVRSVAVGPGRMQEVEPITLHGEN